MADDKKGGDPKKPLQEDQIVKSLMGDATQPPTGLTNFVGLLYHSSKAGYWLLYLTLDMSTCVEIQEDDIVHSEQLPPDKSPFGSLGGTQVFVRKGAKVTTTRTVTRTHEAGDEFDLDIKLGGRAQQALPAQCFGTQLGTTCLAECGGGGTGDANTCFTCVSCGDTCFRTCRDTCRTLCDTCPGDTCGITCDTCQTQCQNTCVTCAATCQTCQTKCGQATCQATCQTCFTRCGQATCGTCNTQCGQATCDTCRTQCDTCPGDTCAACTHVTCFNTCEFCFRQR